MLILRPTARLRKEAGISDRDLSDLEDFTEGLDTWYAELIRIGHEKIVLFLNSRTLYPIVARNLNRGALGDLRGLFLDRLESILFSEGVEPELYQRIISNFGEASFAKTASRSVIGSMNDLSKHLVFDIKDELRGKPKDELSLSIALSKIPMSGMGIGMGFPNNAFSEVLQVEFGWKGEFRSSRYARHTIIPADANSPVPRAVVSLTIPECQLILGFQSLSKESRASLVVPEGTRNSFEFQFSEAELSSLLLDISAHKNAPVDRKIQIKVERIFSNLHRAKFELQRPKESRSAGGRTDRPALQLVTWPSGKVIH